MPHFIVTSSENDLFHDLARHLALSATQQQLLHVTRLDLRDWLAAPLSSLYELEPRVQAVGDLSLGTETPLPGGCWEVEMTVELPLHTRCSPQTAFRLLGRRLAAHPAYLQGLRAEGLAWRLDTDLGVHIRLIPAVPDLANWPDGLFVPGLDGRSWRPLAPQRFARWFRDAQGAALDRALIAASPIAEVAEFAPVPRTALQIAIQLLKRHRDLAFAQRPDLAPDATLLTTLATLTWRDTDDVLTTLNGFADHLLDPVEQVLGRPVLLNPVESRDNLASAWSHDALAYDQARAWLKGLRRDLDMLDVGGAPTTRSSTLARMFGDELAATGNDAEAPSLMQMASGDDTAVGQPRRLRCMCSN